MSKQKISYITTLILILLFIFAFLYQMISSNNIQANISSLIHKENTKSTASSGNLDSTENNVKKIAITFDDGPHPKYTEKLLEGLKDRNVKATFFIIGENAALYPDIVKKISEDGHLIGNHTYSHVNLSCISIDNAILEITKTNDLIKQYTGITPKYIRPPYGLYSNSLKKETNLTPILWTIDPRDWSVLNTDSVVKHVLKRAKDGDIILLHDIFDTSVEAAFKIIDELKSKGYEFVTVDEFY